MSKEITIVKTMIVAILMVVMIVTLAECERRRIHHCERAHRRRMAFFDEMRSLKS